MTNVGRALARQSLAEKCAAVVGPEGVLTAAEDLRFYSTDVYHSGAEPTAVVRPATIAQLQAIVALAYAERVPLAVRGGGASYTDGYLLASAGGIIIDTVRLDQIEIDEANALVTVEAGVTWAALYKALAERELRTPFWGPYSGLKATVGGSISQHSISHGSSAFGASGESLVAIEVITGTGERLATGSAGSRVPHPFFRHFGPDLAGLFTGDCGALGVKARITLRLLRRRPDFAAVSLSFSSFANMHEAMRRIALEAVDDENFGLDAALQQGQIGKQDSVSAKVGIAKSVMKNSRSFGSGVRSLAKMAVAGDRALRAADYVVHYLCDGVGKAEAEANAQVVRTIGREHGSEIPNTVPIIVRGMPFAPFDNILGPRGERWAPMHAVLPHQAAVPFHNAMNALYEARETLLASHGIIHGAMFMAVSTHAFVYEPAFYWPDARTAYHERMLPEAAGEALPRYPRAPAAAAAVAAMRGEVLELMTAHGAAHLQVGKVYPYLPGRNPAAVALLRAVKAELDPAGILNPGALGL